MGFRSFMDPSLGFQDEYGAVVYLRQMGIDAGVHEQFSAEGLSVEPEAGFIDVQLPHGVSRLGVESVEADTL